MLRLEFDVIPARLIVLLLPMAAGLGGCSAYDDRYAFEPKPAVIETTEPDIADQPLARTLVSVVGVRRADKRTGMPRAVEMRVRLENPGSARLTVNPCSFRLLSADLREFEPPMLMSSEPMVVEPAANVLIETLFPFPAVAGSEGVDLSALELQWEIERDGRRFTHVTTLNRRRPVYRTRSAWAYPAPYWYSRDPFCHDRYWLRPRHRHRPNRHRGSGGGGRRR